MPNWAAAPDRVAAVTMPHDGRVFVFRWVGAPAPSSLEFDPVRPSFTVRSPIPIDANNQRFRSTTGFSSYASPTAWGLQAVPEDGAILVLADLTSWDPPATIGEFTPPWTVHP